MAERALQWRVRAALRCHVARSVVLDQARPPCPQLGIATLGGDIVLSRGRAKICWQHDHAGAVKRMRYIADQIGLDNPVERAFPTREAAISAASTNHWRQYVAVQAAVRWGATPCSGVRRLAQTALGARRRCLESRVRQLAQRTPKCAPRCFPAAVRRVSAGYRTTYGTTAGRGHHWRCRAPG